MPHILSNHAVLLGAGNSQGYAAGDNINITDYVISGKDWTSEIESAVSGKQDKFTLGNNLTWYSGTVLDVNNKDCVTMPNTVALGLSASALGNYSFANGKSTVANGNNSHAEGAVTLANNAYSHSEGSATSALGQYSHAEGNSAYSDGLGSHAEGYSTSALGFASHSEGYRTRAYGQESHAEGSNTSAIGSNSHAEGVFTIASSYRCHAEGSQTSALGDASHAEGASTQAKGSESHAEGRWSIAQGDQSHAEGEACKTMAFAAHAEGFYTSATNTASHSEGSETSAAGEYSHAEGRETSALGQYSHSEGQWTVAAGDGSIAAGNGVSAIGWGQVVLGSYNLPNASHILQIGCGVGDIGDQRKNAIEVRGDASVWYRHDDNMYKMRPYSAGDGITINDYVIASHPSVPKHGGWVYAGDTGSVSYTAMAGDTFQIQFEKEEGNYLGNIKVYNSSEDRFMHAIVNYGTPISINELQTETVLTGITDYGIARLDIVGMGVGNEIPRCSFTIAYNVTNGGLYYTVYDEYLY